MHSRSDCYLTPARRIYHPRSSDFNVLPTIWRSCVIFGLRNCKAEKGRFLWQITTKSHNKTAQRRLLHTESPSSWNQLWQLNIRECCYTVWLGWLLGKFLIWNTIDYYCSNWDTQQHVLMYDTSAGFYLFFTPTTHVYGCWRRRQWRLWSLNWGDKVAALARHVGDTYRRSGEIWSWWWARHIILV